MERTVSIALQVFGERFIPEYKMGAFIYDFAFPRLKLLMEIDSWTWHSSRTRKIKDCRKNEFAAERGWQVVRLKVGPKIGLRACQAIREARLRKIEQLWGKDNETVRQIYAMTYGAKE